MALFKDDRPTVGLYALINDSSQHLKHGKTLLLAYIDMMLSIHVFGFIQKS